MLTLALALAAAALGDDPDYRQDGNWLCRPERQDACTQDLTTTVIAADGSRTIETFEAARDPKFDCFYVYPTVSLDTTPNSDLVPGTEEMRVIQFQAARFGAKCRVFAPMYRQVTLTALRAIMAGGTPAVDREMAYRDVEAAWNDYLAHDNKGRGVVLIGHSQGSLVLTQLIGRAIEGKPAQKLLISAMLIGSNVPVLEGRDTGVFKTISYCHTPDQAGCVVSFASFRSESPPPADSRFGKGDRPGTEAICTNPAALGGGKAVTRNYLVTAGSLLGDAGAPLWSKDGRPVTTPFVSVPGLLSAECVRKDGFHYLAVTTNADPADPRTDDVGGDIKVGPGVLKSWGLHLIDMNIAQGDLIALADSQAKAWAAKH
ncbi:MAG: DUF3089 domain-containing protein [Sphingomonas sp.]|uniref:DUF3089 domain-containing protein n=1 Tax=Sphingomonas sp. TaxID=28214 RepID=UPI0025D07423|nr:DUF3089 domain-containing protein [Sphingomonas sp.]MBX3566109.1 DUF3089 domain-containing protein [Sphingomonas sp.]